MNTHKINSHSHSDFLNEKRQDPITGDLIVEGDEIVFCQECKSAFLKSSWEYLNEKIHVLLHNLKDNKIFKFKKHNKKLVLNTVSSILNTAKSTIALESKAINNLSELLTDDFANAVELIYNSKGRVIITGIGKSAIIANKIVATLNSTGTPSVFMHAADAIHGDLGLILKDDVVICISKSGN